MKTQAKSPRLRPGDLVEVRAAADILATLDHSGALDALPFMPEMLQFVGQRFVVSTRVERICDTIGPGGSRRMSDTVFLDDLRCDGSAHGGCQAECRIYWKEAWLAKVENPASGISQPVAEAQKSAETLNRISQLNAIAKGEATTAPTDDVFRCQATEAFRASQPITRSQKPVHYLRELSSGNVSLAHFLQVAARALYWKLAPWLAPNSLLTKKSHASTPEKYEKLGLRPADWVEVKSSEEILRTLNTRGRNRGLGFSPCEMLPFCGKKFRVKQRVERIIDERTGRMLVFKNDCLVLEGVVCAGDRSTGRWFCPRGLYPYWREAWLRRADAPLHSESAGPQMESVPGD